MAVNEYQKNQWKEAERIIATLSKYTVHDAKSILEESIRLLNYSKVQLDKKKWSESKKLF